MTTNLPDNFLSYHFSTSFPRFASSRPHHIEQVLENFNILGLLKNLFSPYKRMTLTGKVSLSEKLSYNIISSLVGAMARIGLVLAGVFVTIFFVIFDFLAIGFYLTVPILSYLEYSQLQNEHITSADLSSNDSLIAKLSKTKIYSILCTFFDTDFKNLFFKMPASTILEFKVGQKSYEPFLTLTDKWPDLKSYLDASSIKQEDFKLLVSYLNDLINTKRTIKPPPIGQTLIYGYTNMLERFGTDITSKYHPPFYGKKEMLGKIEKILTRAENNNVVLVGEPGVGKHTILDALAGSINRGELLSLQDKRLVLLDIVALLGTTKTITEAQSTFENLLTEAKRAGNIILAIDEIDRITTGQDGRTDLSEVINTLLTDNSLPLLGISSVDNFNQFIRPNSSMNSLFERVDAEEPARDELITIMVAKAVNMLEKDKMQTSFSAILEIVDESSRLMADKKQPEKSIIILEDATSEAKRGKLTQLDVETVDEVISAKSRTPIGKISQTEAEKLSDLETLLHKRIVGQSEAIVQISKAMRRARAQMEKTSKPMGSFLFLGPTGVGKTETAKALAQTYFGNENKMVRLDMTEFQATDAASRLIGNPQTKTPGQLTTQIREQPYGILLVDEFEKASRDVQNLFLQILDEGHLTDAFGKKVSFTNIIVIATSNAAAEFIREEVEKTAENPSTNLDHMTIWSHGTVHEPLVLSKNEGLTKKLIDYVLSKGLFSPELINRFDATVVFKPLNRQEVVQVAYLMLQNLATQIKDSKNITLEISPELAQAVAKEGFVQAFGARPIRRLIADKIEDEIAKLLISRKIKNGDTIHSQDLQKFLS